MWIEPGKPVSLEDLERGVVISSGNDASVAWQSGEVRIEFVLS